MLVATSGHIDHGKTSLIRALTGVETDRLPEELARGISIDLGFAYWRPDAGAMIGFIDVPGHERFVRNMLAGVSGTHAALLVVAADDGVMPQTVEHLRILGLMGIGRGVVALTKCDRASPARIAQVRAQLAGLLGTSPLAAAPICEVSSRSGEGIEEIAAALLALRGDWQTGADKTRGFRLAIDRAFTIPGAGTVVTGTAIAGMLTTGAELTVSPLGREVRVRGLQCGGAKVEVVAAGQRCALNLAGIEVGEVHRGDWLVEPGLHAPTTRIEARLRQLGEQTVPLRHEQRVHLHIGTADLGARILTPRQRAVQPGEEVLAQLVLDAPTSAVTGQRFVLRDQSGRQLLGGGVVLDPAAVERRRTLAMREAIAGAFALPTPAEALAELAAIPGFEPDSSWFAHCGNLTDAAIAEVVAQVGFVTIGRQAKIIIDRTRFARLGEALIAAIGQHHLTHPELGGMTRRGARLALGEPVSAELLDALIRGGEETGRIAGGAGLLRLPGHAPRFSDAERAMWQSLLESYGEGAPRPILVAELARELQRSEAAVRAMLFRRRINGDVWQVSEARFMLREHVAALVAAAAALDAAAASGFTAAQFRDATGVGRNFTIQLLEFFDRIGVTLRLGDLRRIRADYEVVVASGEM